MKDSSGMTTMDIKREVNDADIQLGAPLRLVDSVSRGFI